MGQLAHELKNKPQEYYLAILKTLEGKERTNGKMLHRVVERYWMDQRLKLDKWRIPAYPIKKIQWLNNKC